MCWHRTKPLLPLLLPPSLIKLDECWRQILVDVVLGSIWGAVFLFFSCCPLVFCSFHLFERCSTGTFQMMQQTLFLSASSIPESTNKPSVISGRPHVQVWVEWQQNPNSTWQRLESEVLLHICSFFPSFSPLVGLSYPHTGWGATSFLMLGLTRHANCWGWRSTSEKYEKSLEQRWARPFRWCPEIITNQGFIFLSSKHAICGIKLWDIASHSCC